MLRYDFMDKEMVEVDIPEDMKEKAKNARSLLLEAAVEHDDDVMMKFLEEGEESISEAEFKASIRKAVLSGDFFPVTGGDGRGVIESKWPIQSKRSRCSSRDNGDCH